MFAISNCSSLADRVVIDFARGLNSHIATLLDTLFLWYFSTFLSIFISNHVIYKCAFPWYPIRLLFISLVFCIVLLLKFQHFFVKSLRASSWLIPDLKEKTLFPTVRMMLAAGIRQGLCIKSKIAPYLPNLWELLSWMHVGLFPGSILHLFVKSCSSSLWWHGALFWVLNADHAFHAWHKFSRMLSVWDSMKTLVWTFLWGRGGCLSLFSSCTKWLVNACLLCFGKQMYKIGHYSLNICKNSHVTFCVKRLLFHSFKSQIQFC